MTLRDSSVRNPQRKGDRTLSGRIRDKRRRKDRRLLSESLEQRQLLAGPDLIGIQPNDGQLIRGGEVLEVAPRELVFRFDDQSDLDPLTIADGISITRAGDDGGFETATTTTDLGTGGTVLVEFRASESGVRGNGIEVRLRSADRGTSSQQVLVSVNSVDRIVELDLNSNPGRPSTVRDLIAAIEGNPDARALIEADQVSGSSLSPVGPSVGDGIDLVLSGANAAQFVTDLGTGGQVRARFVAATGGTEGVGTTIAVSRANLNLQPGQLPFVSVSGKSIQVIVDSTPGNVSTVADLITAINSNPDASNLVLAEVEFGNVDAPITNTTFSPITLVGATDTVVEPGFIGLGDTPHEVVFRFAEPLPQDTYQIEIFGAGPFALRNVDGEAFSDGENFGVQFALNNAPQVAAVVPTPVRRQANGSLAPELNVVDVYFNEDIENATDPSFYELIYTRDTAINWSEQDESRRDVPVQPSSVSYDPTTRVASLTFDTALSRVRDPYNPTQFLSGAIRLRVGAARVQDPNDPLQGSIPDAPVEENVSSDPLDYIPSDLNDLPSFDLSTGGAGIKSLIVKDQAIQNSAGEYELQFPGGSDVPGVRNIRPEDPSRLDRTVPLDVWRRDGDDVEGISTVYYDFPDSWLGDDPNIGLASEPDRLQRYFNLITEEQKQRIREVVSLYSEYLGVQFVETDGVPAEAASENSAYVAIAVGELYGAGVTTFDNSEVGGVTVATRPLDANGNTFLASDPDAPEHFESGNNLLVMDFQDFDASVDDQLGGEFFRGGLLGVGQLLGYGYADHLPQPVTQATGSVLSPGLDNEPSYPSPSDIVNGQYLYRPESNDIDLYRFTLDRPGKINIQTVAERLQSASSLDTALRLYGQVGGRWQEIAANDDYFSDDSLIELELQSGDYIVGVSASGNTVYDPSISGTGIGGRTEGQYDLRITFESAGGETLVDRTQLALDGDLDGRAGGEFNFWFLPTDPVSTIYVDQSYAGPRSGAPGSSTNPYTSVNRAVEDAGVDFEASGTVQQVRVVGGTYTIGLDNSGIPSDGSTLELPQGVQLVVDAGATFRMRRSRIGVGSTTEGVDRSNSSIQVLGVPGNPVLFTSSAQSPKAGDWGGIDIRGDIDASDESRTNPENDGIFLNHIQHADIRYGGGPVSVDGRQVKVSPIEMAVTRPTVINSRISDSADAAMSATPDTFAETRFDEYRFQREESFTPDVMRSGPHIRGNLIVDNSINGLFFRIETRAGDSIETLNVNARIDDTDVVHVLADNLLIEGRVGGPDASIAPPSALLVRGSSVAGGGLTAGNYVYKLTFVNRDGYETDASDSSIVISVPSDNRAINLTGLPTVPQTLRDQGFTGRRLYRAEVSGGITGTFNEVASLNSNDRSFTDSLSNDEIEDRPTIGPENVRLGRTDPGLKIDPGAVLKMQGARIDVTLGANLYAEGTDALPIVMTSARDDRFGTGGTFDTVSSSSQSNASPGDWGGVYVGFGADASFDHVTIAGGGGATRVEGGFGSFNTIEVHQANLRVANSRFESNADGRSFVNDPLDVRGGRVGRGDNASGTIFVRASQPVLINNEFINGNGPAMTFDVNSFTWQEVTDSGRSTGELDALEANGNSGPLIQGNRIGTTRLNSLDPDQDPDEPINRNYAPYDALGENPIFDEDGNPIFATLNGLEVRGGQVATEVVLDDVDVVHIVRDLIEVPNQHIYGGLRLQSDARGSLVVKFQNQDLDNPDTLARRHAGIIVGGNLITAEDQFIDIDDRIGGSLQIVGHPDFPVILTSLLDDNAGAGFTPDGRANLDTDNNGFAGDAAAVAEQGSGTWDGVTIREAASDENVLMTSENEPRNIGNIVVNDPNRFRVRNEIPGDAQFLGELASSVSAGDNIRRLGFIVDGTIAKPNDLDVYSFVGEAGTQVWLDIDRTNSRLDTVIELIDANGNIRVLSDNSLTEAQGTTSRLTPNFDADEARPLNSNPIPSGSSTSEFQDLYSTNPRDAGMRLVLPGNVGQRFLYHVRVRSSNSDRASSATLLDAEKVREGKTSGAYQLQVRLQEQDVFAGTQIRFSDVRYADNGVEIIGGPNHSPILADEYETRSSNDTLANAQRLGLYETRYDATIVNGNPVPLPPGVSIGNNGGLNYDRNVGNTSGQQFQNVTLDNAAGPLSSDRLAKSVAGFLDDTNDVDWFEFEVGYKQLTRDSTARYLSTVFDLDYADGVARADTSIYVFDALGNLVLVGSDSNIADDQPVGQADESDLSRGSFGSGDPFIGVAELLEGTYFVAVSNKTRVPGQMDQFFQQNSVNPLLRLEPIDSIRRIAEDHIGSSGGGTATPPEVPLLFDDNSIIPYSLDDVLLYVNTGTRLEVVNPFTGEQYPGRPGIGSLGNFTGGEVIRDIAFRANGELFGYTGNGPVVADDATEYVRIDTSNASLNVVGNLGIQTFHLTNFDPTNLVLDATSDDGIQVEAISIRSFTDLSGVTEERGFLVGNRPIVRDGLQYISNVLFEFDDATGAVIGPTYDRSRFSPGSGTTPREVGQINTADPNVAFDENYLGITDATVVGANGVASPSLFDGDAFTVSNVTDAVTFEFDQSFTLIADTNRPIVDGDAVTIDSVVFEFNTDSTLDRPGAIEVPVSPSTAPEALIRILADTIRDFGIAVSDAGTQLALPASSSVLLEPNPSAVRLTGAPGVASGHVPILLLPTDSAATIASRIAIAVQEANDSGDLPNVTANPRGELSHSVEFVGGFVSQASGNLTIGGVANGGFVTGIEVLGNQLYAVTNTGGLYEVSRGELDTYGNRRVGRYVPTATDLRGINFTGLRAGPYSVDGGAVSTVLFGITGNGDIYAFNRSGELLPVFAGGRSSISTGIGGAVGLDFSVVDFNLWHVTNRRGDDAGHGINPTFNGARPGTSGGSSLAFNYENGVFAGNYPTNVEQPTFAPRLDGGGFEATYNVPGGAKGVVQSNPFSLSGYAEEDLPTLYFNYFMETEAVGGRDALRVFVVTSEGVEHLVATNNLILRPGTADDEFDDPSPFAFPAYDDDIDVETQPLFDATGAANPQWRQARVPLGEFAGQSGLSLRIEFSTSGSTESTSEALRVVSGQVLAEGDESTFVINDSPSGPGETFLLQLAPTISFPSGLQLANLYADPAETAVITIDDQEYLLNDGTRIPETDQISINLLAGAPTGTSLADLSAEQIAATVATQIQASPGAAPTVNDFNFSPEDAGGARNDLIFEATPLPYNGGNQTFNGFGRLGTVDNPLVPPTNLDDVDLVRLEVRQGATIAVDVDLDFNSALNAAIRFFDSAGNEVQGIQNPTNDTVEYTATADGVVFIGISGLGNENYDPRIPGSAQVGQVDSYTVSLDVRLPSAYQADGSVVEFAGGQLSVNATPGDLFRVTQRTSADDATAIPVSRFMTANEVAVEVQRAIANRYTQGNTDLIPTSGPTVRLPSLFIDDSGPFANEGDRYSFGPNAFAPNANPGFVQGTENNDFEGIYLDDFIIGFAERGELATGGVAEDPNGSFVANGSLSLTLPVQSTQPTDKGPYQLEIRDGSEYVSGGSIAVNQADIQRFASAPIVVPINGIPYGVADGSVASSSVIPAIQRPPFQIYDLPTLDVVVDAATGQPITQFAGGSLVVTLDDGAGTQVPLIELDGSFKPLVTSFTAVSSEGRFRTFDTNDRLTGGYSFETQAASSMTDGSSFAIFDSLNRLDFEFDVRPAPTPDMPNPVFDGPNNPDAVVIEIESGDSAAVVANKIINVINSPNVRAVLDVMAARSNSSLPGDVLREFQDSRVNLYGDITFVEVTPSFRSVTLASQRGDANRDRSQQGLIIVENSRFLFNAQNGVSIVRDAETGLASQDQRDEFPVALVYPQNLLELNSEGLLPGVVVQNNVLGFNDNAGIFVTGITGGGGAIITPVGYDQIINNTLIGGVVEEGVDLGTEIFSGYLFPRGGISFADEVDLDSLSLGSDVDAEYTDPQAALSSPDGTGRGPEPDTGEFTLSLGTGGQATFRFTDNLLTGNDSPTPDLVIFETGASESVRVEISRDGQNFFFVGNASGLSPTIDIDQFGFDSNDRFAFVRVTDLISPLDEPTVMFGPAGADIDAIGAISTVPADQFTPGSEGIVVTHNSGPTLLNNILANFDTGIVVSESTGGPNTELSKDRTVIGGSSYFRNVANTNGGTQQDLGLFSQRISDFQPIFVDPVNLVFTPQAGAPTIDSSIDSLQDRASLLTVRSAVGLPPVPILAPLVDLNGQLRVDDPGVETPPGVGLSVFKDRGAEDRADEIGPRVTLISPRADDLQRDIGQVVTSATIFDSFDIQLIDGITPADPSSGVGVSDVTLSDGTLIRVSKMTAGSETTETLVQGIDYRYAYEPSDNIIRLTPIAGIWEDNSVYTIELLGRDVSIIKGEAATQYADGAITQVDLLTQVGNSEIINRRAIELDTGIGLSIAPGALTTVINGVVVPNIQGQAVEIFDGQSDSPQVFELTTTNDPNINDAIIARGAIPVRVGQQASANQIAQAVAAAINQSDVKLFATAVGNRIQLRDSVVKGASLFAIEGISVSGAAAYLGADIAFTSDLRGLDVVGQTYTVFDGDNEVTFSLVSDPSQAPAGTTPVVISPTARRTAIAEAMKAGIDASGLQLSATVDGGVLAIRGLSDRVDPNTALAYALPLSLTGDPLGDAFKLTNYSLDVTLTDVAIAAIDGPTVTIFDGQNQVTFEFDSAAFPGVLPGNVPVPVPANATAREMLQSLRNEIQAAGLDVQVVNAARSFRITGTMSPISVTSADNAVTVTGFGMIGTSPGFGIGIPSDGQALSNTVTDGQTFTITRGPTSITFELDFDQTQENAGTTLVPVAERTLDAVADAIALAINNARLGLTASNIDAGRVTLSGVDTEDVVLDLSDSALTQIGIAGLPTPLPVVIPLDATEAEIAEAYEKALEDLRPLGVESEQIGDRVIVRSNTDGLRLSISGTSVVEQRISDEVRNEADAEGLPSLVIFVGGGFDYGDAPSPYASTAAQLGPRHFVDDDFALWIDDPFDPTDRPVTRDSDAKLPDADDDNGVFLESSVRPGFDAQFLVGIHNVERLPWVLDVWTDWNGNGIFEQNRGELTRFLSENPLTGQDGLDLEFEGRLPVKVSNAAKLGEVYARFRLYEQSELPLGPIGDASSGEVEDLKLVVTSNPFTNPDLGLRSDVNDSGEVTPLDALNIINALARNNGQNIFLDDEPLPVALPPYPDVNSDGIVSASDALTVINDLAAIVEAMNEGAGELLAQGESTAYVQAATGVLASAPTWLGDAMLAEEAEEELAQDPPAEETSSVGPAVESGKTSVFDNPAMIELDSIVDDLADDAAAARDGDDDDILDQVFASF